jgi:hypothetical protein
MRAGLFHCPTGRFVSGIGFRANGRQAFEPLAQFVGQNDGASTALSGGQFAGLDRLVKGCSASACGRACLLNSVCKWCAHVVLVFGDAYECALMHANMLIKLATE